mgnify:CR=1 FL=1
MIKIDVSLVKNLREQTGAGRMDCKRALEENDGDITASIDWLVKGMVFAIETTESLAFNPNELLPIVY